MARRPVKTAGGMEAHESILDTIGNTPVVRLRRLANGLRPTILLKLESFNPGGSVKDRIATAMIDDAERRGLLRPGGTIVEPTSGNTGMGLALVAAVRGYRCVFTIPDKMAKEKIDLLKAFGAKVIVCPTAVAPEHPESYYKVAERIARETPNAFMPNQYANPMNPEAHYLTTGPEIWRQTGGRITHFVCGQGTGGTISGVGKYLKEKNRNVKVIGVDPYGSVLRDAFMSGRPSKSHVYKIEGIGEDFVPATTHFEYIDDVIKVGDKEAMLMTRRLAREEGILAGSSAGAAVAGALRVAEKLTSRHVMVVLIPDTGLRYLSKVHSEEWLKEQGYLEEPTAPLLAILRRKGDRLPELITVQATDTIHSATELMWEHGISQLPVTGEGKIVGGVRQDALMTRLLKNPKAAGQRIESVMEKAFPVVDAGASLETVYRLLHKGSPAVLVESEGRVAGIITGTDVVEYLAERA